VPYLGDRNAEPGQGREHEPDPVPSEGDIRGKKHQPHEKISLLAVHTSSAEKEEEKKQEN